MKSPITSQLANALKNQGLTLKLEIPLAAASDSCSSCPKISLELDGAPLPTSTLESPISGIFTKEQLKAQDSETGSLP
jgi:hypothetical protein